MQSLNFFDRWRFALLRLYWKLSSPVDHVYYYDNYPTLRKLSQFIHALLSPRKEAVGKMKGFLIQLPLWGRGVTKYYYRDGFYEKGTTKVVEEQLEPDDLFIDIGANIGYFSLLAATLITKQKGRGKVVAFEPMAASLAFLKKSIALNKLNNISYHTSLVTDQVGEADFYICGKEEVSPINTMFLEETEEGQVRRSPTTSLDAFCAAEKLTPNFIKIDAEGAEPLILKGAQKLLKNKALPLKLLIEIVPARFKKLGFKVKEVLEEMHANGFQIFTIEKAGQLNALTQFSLIDQQLEKAKALEYNLFLLREAKKPKASGKRSSASAGKRKKVRRFQLRIKKKA